MAESITIETLASAQRKYLDAIEAKNRLGTFVCMHDGKYVLVDKLKLQEKFGGIVHCHKGNV